MQKTDLLACCVTKALESIFLYPESTWASRTRDSILRSAMRINCMLSDCRDSVGTDLEKLEPEGDE